MAEDTRLSVKGFDRGEYDIIFGQPHGTRREGGGHKKDDLPLRAVGGNSSEKNSVLSPKLLSQKKSILIGTWNVRTLWEAGKCAQAVKEMQQYHLTVLCLCETRWNTFGETKFQTGETMLYSGIENEDDPREAGVALLLTKEATKSLMEWEPVSDRIIKARFESRFQKTSIIMCYAPTNNADEEEKDRFYEELQSVVDKVPKRDMLILMGDLNAKVGKDNRGMEMEMGTNGLGEINENDHHTENQIEHVAARRHWRTSLQDVRTKRGADIGSNHHLVVAKLKMKLKAKKRQHEIDPRRRFDVSKLKTQDNRTNFQVTLKNRFEALQTKEKDFDSVKHTLEIFKQATIEACEEALGGRAPNRKPWITDDS
ncbi:craniofacial development protein 2-like [Physella acuta]|uniref:craniofacial development protein 2-like n=1 Tax=Physella acuta TaxID=109671 RepID=UPI0027DE1D12|nr:craniofacial development protein 2-like [Physella acuta]